MTIGLPKKVTGRSENLSTLCLLKAAQAPARPKATARQMCEHLKEKGGGEEEREGGKKRKYTHAH